MPITPLPNDGLRRRIGAEDDDQRRVDAQVGPLRIPGHGRFQHLWPSINADGDFLRLDGSGLTADPVGRHTDVSALVFVRDIWDD